MVMLLGDPHPIGRSRTDQTMTRSLNVRITGLLQGTRGVGPIDGGIFIECRVIIAPAPESEEPVRQLVRSVLPG